MSAATLEAFAGHAGETDLLSAMPHEILGGMALLAVIGMILVVIGAIGVWLLFKIERQLRRHN